MASGPRFNRNLYANVTKRADGGSRSRRWISKVLTAGLANTATSIAPARISALTIGTTMPRIRAISGRASGIRDRFLGRSS